MGELLNSEDDQVPADELAPEPVANQEATDASSLSYSIRTKQDASRLVSGFIDLDISARHRDLLGERYYPEVEKKIRGDILGTEKTDELINDPELRRLRGLKRLSPEDPGYKAYTSARLSPAIAAIDAKLKSLKDVNRTDEQEQQFQGVKLQIKRLRAAQRWILTGEDHTPWS